jgi:hypothetical protein
MPAHRERVTAGFAQRRRQDFDDPKSQRYRGTLPAWIKTLFTFIKNPSDDTMYGTWHVFVQSLGRKFPTALLLMIIICN